MPELNEKSTMHNVIVRILSERAVTYDSVLFNLVKSIDKDILAENDLLLLGFDFEDQEPGTPERTEKGSKLAEWAARSPGVLGDLLNLFKGRSARDYYIGFCGTVLLGILLYKWILRLVTGAF